MCVAVSVANFSSEERSVVRGVDHALFITGMIIWDLDREVGSRCRWRQNGRHYKKISHSAISEYIGSQIYTCCAYGWIWTNRLLNTLWRIRRHLVEQCFTENIYLYIIIIEYKIIVKINNIHMASFDFSVRNIFLFCMDSLFPSRLIIHTKNYYW